MTKVSKPQNFFLANGKLVIDEKWMQGPLGNFILEVGPFFNPLISTKNFPEKKLCYWENDLYVLQWLLKINDERQVKPIYCDLNMPCLYSNYSHCLQQRSFEIFQNVLL